MYVVDILFAQPHWVCSVVTSPLCLLISILASIFLLFAFRFFFFFYFASFKLLNYIPSKHRERQDQYRQRILKLQTPVKYPLHSHLSLPLSVSGTSSNLALLLDYVAPRAPSPWQTPLLSQLQQQHFADHSQIYLSKPTLLLLLSRPAL